MTRDEIIKQIGLKETLYDEVKVNLMKNYIQEYGAIGSHQIAISYDYDCTDDDFLLNYIINNPLTDKATALAIYWLNEPPCDDEDSFVGRAMKKLLSGFYKNQNFAFDPKDFYGEDLTQGADIGEVPKELFMALKGEHIPYPENFIVGTPECIYDELEIIADEISLLREMERAIRVDEHKIKGLR